MRKLFKDRIHETFQNKRILITGASGYLATNLVNALKEVDCTIIRLSRKNILATIKGKVKISDYQGDIVFKETWEQVLSGVDIVKLIGYHLYGKIL